MEIFRSERCRSLGHGDEAPSTMGMRALEQIGGQGSLQLGSDQTRQGCETKTCSVGAKFPKGARSESYGAQASVELERT